MTGNTFSKFEAVTKAVNLQFFSRSVFSRIQREKLFPVIQETWQKERSSVVEELKVHPNLILTGDGRCDSPGHTAKYGAYTLTHASGDGQEASRKIVDLQLVQCSEVKNSNHMEPEGMRRGLKNLLDKDKLPVKVLATDQHIMIGSIMKKEFPSVDHQYDVWHVAKNMKKKLTAKSVSTECAPLAPWIQSISNHFWWSCATCKNDEQLLRDKWVSVLSHIVNKHRWSGSVKYKKCAHGRLSRDEEAETAWLKAGQPAHKALQAVVEDKNLLKASSHLTRFCHTGELEVFHSMLLKFCSKRQDFPYAGMKARLLLAALEWNNRQRHQVTSESGGKNMMSFTPKKRKTWVIRVRYARQEPRHLETMLRRVVEIHTSKISLPPMEVPQDLPAHISSMEKPAKSVLLSEKQTRFLVQ